MLIEIKLQFGKKGVTISQRIEPSPSPASEIAVPLTESHLLKSSFAGSTEKSASKSGGSSSDKLNNDGGSSSDKLNNDGGGVNDFGMAPVILIGPIIIGSPLSGFEDEKD